MVMKQNQAYNYGLIGKFKAVNHLNNYSNRLIINFSFVCRKFIKNAKAIRRQVKSYSLALQF